MKRKSLIEKLCADGGGLSLAEGWQLTSDELEEIRQLHETQIEMLKYEIRTLRDAMAAKGIPV